MAFDIDTLFPQGTFDTVISAKYARLQRLKASDLSLDDMEALQTLEPFGKLIDFCAQHRITTLDNLSVLLASEEQALNEALPLVQAQYLQCLLPDGDPLRFIALGSAFYHSPAQFTGFLYYLLQKNIGPETIVNSNLLTQYFAYNSNTIDHVTWVYQHLNNSEMLQAKALVKCANVPCRIRGYNHNLNGQQRHPDEVVSAASVPTITPPFQLQATDSPERLYMAFQTNFIEYLNLGTLIRLLQSPVSQAAALQWLTNHLSSMQPDNIQPLQLLLDSAFTEEEGLRLLSNPENNVLALCLPLKPVLFLQHQEAFEAFVKPFMHMRTALDYTILTQCCLTPLNQDTACKPFTDNIIQEIFRHILKDAESITTGWERTAPQVQFIQYLLNLKASPINITNTAQTILNNLEQAIAGYPEVMDYDSLYTLWLQGKRVMSLLYACQRGIIPDYPQDAYQLKIKIIHHALEKQRDLITLLNHMVHINLEDPRDIWQEKARTLLTAFVDLFEIATDRQKAVLMDTITILFQEKNQYIKSLSFFSEKPKQYVALIQCLISNHQSEILKVVLETKDCYGISVLVHLASDPKLYISRIQQCLEENDSEALLQLLPVEQYSRRHDSIQTHLYIKAKIEYENLINNCLKNNYPATPIVLLRTIKSEVGECLINMYNLAQNYPTQYLKLIQYCLKNNASETEVVFLSYRILSNNTPLDNLLTHHPTEYLTLIHYLIDNKHLQTLQSILSTKDKHYHRIFNIIRKSADPDLHPLINTIQHFTDYAATLSLSDKTKSAGQEALVLGMQLLVNVKTAKTENAFAQLLKTGEPEMGKYRRIGKLHQFWITIVNIFKALCKSKKIDGFFRTTRQSHLKKIEAELNKLPTPKKP